MTETQDQTPDVLGLRRILAVDDDPIMLELLTETFTGLGFGVSVAGDGDAAWSILQSDAEFQLAVIDLSMPIVDGYELLSRIRNNPQSANLPVIVATSTGDAASIEHAYRLGASSFVTKPINWPQFAHHAQFVIRNGQVERDLRVAQAEAAATARMKNGLFSVLGHELKTPLTALVGLTDVLAKSLGVRLQSMDAEHLGHVTEAAQRLNSIVSDILTLSRALAGAKRLELSWTTADELIEDSLLGFKTRSSLLGIELKHERSNASVKICCDPHLVRQGLRKLIDNAIKFSQPGSAINLWADDDGVGNVAIHVRDCGPGISVSRLRECLQPFVQGDMTYARPAEGLGLGLPIANAIAEAHGGELSVTTTPGEGLIATLKLPHHAGLAALSA